MYLKQVFPENSGPIALINLMKHFKKRYSRKNLEDIQKLCGSEYNFGTYKFQFTNGLEKLLLDFDFENDRNVTINKINLHLKSGPAVLGYETNKNIIQNFLVILARTANFYTVTNYNGKSLTRISKDTLKDIVRNNKDNLNAWFIKGVTT